MLLDESVWLHERAWPSIAAYLERCDIALVPIGATEQHGYHMPLGVDPRDGSHSERLRLRKCFLRRIVGGAADSR